MMFPNSVLPKDHPYRDFRNFLFDLWEYLGLPEPDPLQYDMAWWLQYGPKRSISEAFRGFGKSYITVAFACWCWLNDPDFKVMVVSGSGKYADEFTRFCLMLLRDFDPISHLHPRQDQLRSLSNFEVNGAKPSKSPACKSVGINGQLTGSRADLIIADDVETPKNSMTVGQREKLEVLVREFDAVLKTDDHARVVYLGTPQNEDSLYNKLQTKGYKLRVWTARVPEPSKVVDKYGDALSPLVASSELPAGSPLVERFGETQLMEREASYGASGFALQFMLDTSLEDDLKFPLKCRDLIVTDLDRSIAPVRITWASGMQQLLTELDCSGLKGDRFYGPMYVSDDFTEYEGKVMFIDPAGRGKDRTGYCVVNHLKGMLYVRRWGTLEGGYEDTALDTLAQIARAEQVTSVHVESNFGDGMFNRLLAPVLQRIHPVGLEEYRVSTQKEARIIDTLEPLLNQHRLVMNKSILEVDKSAPQAHSLIYQMTRMCRMRGALGHDDGIDVLAAACAYWVELLLEDMDDVEEDHTREQIDRVLDEWLEDAGVGVPRKDSWRTGRKVHE